MTRNKTPATDKAWRVKVRGRLQTDRRRQAKHLPWSRMTEQQRIAAIEAVRHGQRTGK